MREGDDALAAGRPLLGVSEVIQRQFCKLRTLRGTMNHEPRNFLYAALSLPYSFAHR